MQNDLLYIIEDIEKRVYYLSQELIKNNINANIDISNIQYALINGIKPKVNEYTEKMKKLEKEN